MKKKNKKKHFDIAFVSNLVTMYNRLCILFLRSGLECHMCMMIITVCESMLADLTLRPLRFTLGNGWSSWQRAILFSLGLWYRWSSLRADLHMSSSTRHFCIKLETLYQTGRSLHYNGLYVDLEGKLLKSLVFPFFGHYIVVDVTISMSQPNTQFD